MFARQDTTTARLLKLSRRALDEQRMFQAGKLFKLWRGTRAKLETQIAMAYRQAAEKGAWNHNTFARVKYSLAAQVKSILTQFHAQSVPFVKSAIKSIYQQSVLRHAWVLDQVTPQNYKIKMPRLTGMREASIITDPGAFEARWSSWMDAYNSALINNLTLNALNEGSISDAMDEVDATRANTPAYTLIDAMTRIFDYQALSAASEGQEMIGDMNGDAVNEEIWRTRGDLRVCDDCDANEGQSVEDIGFPPLHPNCILPGQYVVATDAISGSKAFYEGRCIEVTLVNGRSISVTENHPILTLRGWIKARHLSEVDYLVCSADSERIGFSINPTNDQRPALIENIFRSLLHSSGGSPKHMKVAAEDFHGDGSYIKSEVDIIRPDCRLMINDIAIRKKIVGKLSLDKRNTVTSKFISSSHLDLLGDRNVTAARRNISRSGKFTPTVKADSIHTDDHSVATIPYLHPFRLKTISQGAACDPYLARQFVQRFSGQITSSQILSIRNFNFSGHVYDLQCQEYSLYICNGIIVKNCHCFTEMVPASFAELLRSGDASDNELAAEMEREGIAPNALVIRDVNGSIIAKTIVDFERWVEGEPMAVSGQ